MIHLRELESFIKVLLSKLQKVPVQDSAQLPEQQCKYRLGIDFGRIIMDLHQSK